MKIVNKICEKYNQLKTAEIIRINTITPEDKLDKINVLKLIDFLSLDIESAE